jgi:hypothetical protein
VIQCPSRTDPPPARRALLPPPPHQDVDHRDEARAVGVEHDGPQEAPRRRTLGRVDAVLVPGVGPRHEAPRLDLGRGARGAGRGARGAGRGARGAGRGARGAVGLSGGARVRGRLQRCRPFHTCHTTLLSRRPAPTPCPAIRAHLLAARLARRLVDQHELPLAAEVKDAHAPRGGADDVLHLKGSVDLKVAVAALVAARGGLAREPWGWGGGEGRPSTRRGAPPSCSCGAPPLPPAKVRCPLKTLPPGQRAPPTTHLPAPLAYAAAVSASKRPLLALRPPSAASAARNFSNRERGAGTMTMPRGLVGSWASMYWGVSGGRYGGGWFG